MKTTRWFRCYDEPPVRDGWYDIKWHGDAHQYCRRMYWQKGKWREHKNGPLAEFGNQEPRWAKDSWRGQTKP